MLQMARRTTPPPSRAGSPAQIDSEEWTKEDRRKLWKTAVVILIIITVVPLAYDGWLVFSQGLSLQSQETFIPLLLAIIVTLGGSLAQLYASLAQGPTYEESRVEPVRVEFDDEEFRIVLRNSGAVFGYNWTARIESGEDDAHRRPIYLPWLPGDGSLAREHGVAVGDEVRLRVGKAVQTPIARALMGREHPGYHSLQIDPPSTPTAQPLQHGVSSPVTTEIRELGDHSATLVIAGENLRRTVFPICISVKEAEISVTVTDRQTGEERGGTASWAVLVNGPADVQVFEENFQPHSSTIKRPPSS